MKKLLLTLVTLVTATAASAQIKIFDGADYNDNDDGGFLYNRAGAKIVTEGGVKCLKMVTASNPKGWAHEHFNVLRNISSVNFKGLRRISFRIKMSKSHNVLLKLTSSTGSARRLFYYNGDDTHKDTWQTMVFEYSIGTDNDKVLDENTEMEIWPFEDGDDAKNNCVGQTVFIDDIQLEGPMVNGSAIRTLGDNALTDQQVIVTGSLRKGQYQCTWEDPWHTVDYDDYSLLLSKMSADVCFLNLTGAAVSDGDGPQLRTKNSNLMILSPVEFYDKDNVITRDGSKNVTSKLVLKDNAPFYTPIDFTATEVELTRNVQADINSFYLPFSVTAKEVGAAKIATWKKGVTFTTQESIGANTPFITTGATAAASLNFGEKEVAKTPTTSDGKFVGIYVPQTSTEGKYGINSAGKIQAGNSTTKCNAFHAWLTENPAAAREITIDGDATGINSIENGKQKNDDVWYDLQGRRIGQWSMVNGQLKSGIYIINGKKVVVK